MTKHEELIRNQVLIMESLVVLFAHKNDPILGREDKTWQFEQLVRILNEEYRQ